MGLFEKIFPKPKVDKGAESFFRTLTAYTPVFNSFSGSIYESDLVRSAIHAKANHISKLMVTTSGSAKPKMQTKFKAGPNEFQTWGQFLYRLATVLEIQNTAFIVPILDEYGEIVGVWPALPTQCAVVQDRGVPFLRYTFGSGEVAAIELSMCGIMNKFQYKDDFFGESNAAIYPTMDLIGIQNQGISEAVTSSATYRFMAQVSNFTKPEDLAAERRRFNNENFAKEGGGLLLFPNTYANIQQIKTSPFVVDAAQMSAIKENVYTYFGVNEDVLQNKAFGDAWSAFYEGAIEPFAVQFSDVMTKMCFSQRERASGSAVAATANRLQYMSNKDKLEVSAQMADRGIMNRDEIRQIWNLPSLPNGEGEKYTIRGEYYLLGEEKEGDKNG